MEGREFSWDEISSKQKTDPWKVSGDAAFISGEKSDDVE